MKHNAPLFPAPQMAAVPPERTPFLVWLIVVGIALNTVFSVLLDHSMRGDLGNALLDVRAVQLPAWAQDLGRFSIAIVLLAGILYATSSGGIRLGRRYRALLCLSIAYSLLLAVKHLPPRELLSAASYSSLAPGCALASCLLFAAADRDAWRSFVRLVAYGTVGVSIIVLFEIAQIHSGSRGEAFWRIDTYSKILEISAIVAYAWFAKQRKAWVGAIPLVALLAATIAMQTRLMVMELLSLLIFYRLFSWRKLSINAVVALCVCGLLIVPAVYLAWYSPDTLRSTLPASMSAFWDRSADDTRSNQFVNFFAKVPPSQFVFGMGIPRQGEFGGQGIEGIDLGYVNILFIGGIPALVLFFLLHQLPAIQCLGTKFDSIDAACLASIMTYGVRLFSSTVPGLIPGYFILMVLVGHSVMLVQEKKHPYRSRVTEIQPEELVADPEPVAVASNEIAPTGNPW